MMADNMSSRLEELFTAMQPLRVGVIGDPGSLPGLSMNGEHLPGSCGIAAGLAALGLADVKLFTILDSSQHGTHLLEILRDQGIDTGGVVQVGDGNGISPGDAGEELLRRLESALPQMDAIVISDDLSEGIVTPRMLGALNDFALFAPAMNFVVRSREQIGRFTNMVRMPTQREAVLWLFPDRRPEQVGLEEFAAAALHPQVDCGCPVVVLLGSRGSLVIEHGESHMVRAAVDYPEAAPGSADAFLAAFTAALTAGGDAVEAVGIAHLAAAAAGREQGSPPGPREITALAAGRHER